ncbi:hypothetical protein JW899_01615 [Candidatus Uhrbacteria bacterium]|nr:hypothetical protein [Candidatus Uhrbacteria bacterium]
MTVTVDIANLGFGLVILVFAGLMIAILVMGWGRVRRWIASRKFDAKDLASMRRRWEEIESLSRQPGEMGRKMAIMEADKLLDSALKTMMFAGNTLGERLKVACYRWPEMCQVWWAHKIRNQLAHESSFHLDRSVAARALRSYRSALRLMGVL